ncbi:MAG TPA: GDSL-type esterase/lipase family protein, partial [Thermoanaerobaculia bacterium]
MVVFLGDSLTAGLGLDENQAYPALLGQQLNQEGKAVRVVNAGVSGDTTAGGLSRLDWLLGQHPDVLVVG